ncbi:YigZ family protein [Lachnospiraceae bacterium 56-18]|uniref:YigZ family protein n=1 Tax=Sporofaciens sp. JLR.KK001 TaxID=3112621 RepID=UPI002FF32DAF
MAAEYRTVYTGGEGEIVEKKSRFIATAAPVRSEEEALQIIEQIRKKYWDARHNCYAYVIGERGELERFSDDGEPGGTAGKPILEVIKGEELRNTLIVVTRYFGGTLLGTGGLVRAYSAAAKAGIASSVIITRIPGIKLHITTEYTGLGKIQYILGQRGITTLDSVYTDKVELEVLTAEAEAEAVKAELTEGTNGQAIIETGAVCHFAKINGTPQILD